ncbi:MAG: triose-phosphate isomerase [Deltaproteobacteria bacterium]|nr:MAG: triose-phosphate isomerase [Deltaproteobacteria bacterium]
MSTRIACIAANWKMYKTVGEAVEFVNQLTGKIDSLEDREVVIAPPFTALYALKDLVNRPWISLAAQNCYWEEKGAYTGEISPVMLKDVGCSYTIVGHSERRQYFGEKDKDINKKLKALIKIGIKPIFCVGEKLEEREAGRTFEVVKTQMDGGLEGLDPVDIAKVVIAYEPVWAIGTGKTATPEQAQEVHGFIREHLAMLTNKNIANEIRILYGGSVKPNNVDSLMSEPDIDGALVGGASLEVDSFLRIIRFEA